MSHSHKPAKPPATMLGSVSGFDGIDTCYSFCIYGIHEIPCALNAVYMFCKVEGSTYVPLYIGKAEVLSNRLNGHERKDEAVSHGATHLLVHSPGIDARIRYLEAERRLVANYNPSLNMLHRTIAG